MFAPPRPDSKETIRKMKATARGRREDGWVRTLETDEALIVEVGAEKRAKP
jgi:hypothetical protein